MPALTDRQCKLLLPRPKGGRGGFKRDLFRGDDYEMTVEYVDYAEYYDFDHAITLDIDFYLDLARQCGSPILELACGTGRLLVPLLEAGFEVYGVDISENMLAVCRSKVTEKHLSHRAHLALADMTKFELPRKDFALGFVALRSFMHLLTQEDQLACLQAVYEHLRPGGTFVLNCTGSRSIGSEAG